HRVDDPPAADDGAVDVVVELILDDEPNGSSFAVSAAGRLELHLPIGAGDRPEEIDLLGIKQTFDEKEAVGLKSGKLFGGWRKRRHGWIRGEWRWPVAVQFDLDGIFGLAT